MLLTFHGNVLGNFRFQTFHMNEADINLVVINGGEVLTMVHTRRFDGGAVHPCFMKIKFCSVEPSKVVDHAHHKLQWIMCFQVQTLIALHSIAGGVTFGKRVT